MSLGKQRPWAGRRVQGASAAEVGLTPGAPAGLSPAPREKRKKVLPLGPQYLDWVALAEEVRPTDAQLALCCLYSNRYYTQRRLARASKKLGIPELAVHDQLEDRRVGLRMVVFTGPIHNLSGGVQVAACVFAFRGTRLTKAGTVAADLELLKDRDAELYYSARALRHVRRHVRRLQAAAPAVQWAYFTTGHSLGGFTAVSCAVLCDRMHSAVAFEAPGLTTFYHRAAACRGGPAFWRERVTTYLAIPNPINMCQSHLGRIVRVHFPRLECRTDATHVVRCLLGTGVRLVNWALAASAGVSAMCLAFGVSRNVLVCRLFELIASECAVEVAVPPVAASAYWGLQSAAAFVAARLGTTLRHILQQHSMWHMAQAFNPETGGPARCVEMAGWPKLDSVSETFGATLRRALVEAFWATSTTEGVSVLFDRTAMVEARVRALPGYQPAEEHDDAASEGACSTTSMLRRLGDVFDLWEDEGEMAAPATAAGADAEVCAVARELDADDTTLMAEESDVGFAPLEHVHPGSAAELAENACSRAMKGPRKSLGSPGRSKPAGHVSGGAPAFHR
ncbi:hypothetical protein WJX81_006264 [Elliptochloris bilobata]|uniref:Fungal lipase-like domain-containing protein n=1 Tax=Elliptochloris bilobata TaxID=381761 RepID=A0AAW1SD74_9CHLO